MQSKGLSRVFCSTIVQKHQFFGAQPEGLALIGWIERKDPRCEKHTHQGMDLETGSTVKARLLIRVFNRVSGGQALPGQVQPARISWLTDSSPGPHWLSPVGLHSSRVSPKSHGVFFLLPSLAKSMFLNKDFRASLPKHPVSPGTLQALVQPHRTHPVRTWRGISEPGNACWLYLPRECLPTGHPIKAPD